MSRNFLFVFSVLASAFFFGLAYHYNDTDQISSLTKQAIPAHKNLILKYHNNIFDQTREVQDMVEAYENKKVGLDTIGFSAHLYNLYFLDTVESNKVLPYGVMREPLQLTSDIFNDHGSQYFHPDASPHLKYSHIRVLENAKKKPFTLIETFLVRKQTFKVYLKTFRFDYTILSRNKENKWSIISSSFDKEPSDKLQGLIQNDLNDELEYMKTFKGNKLPEFDWQFDKNKFFAFAVALAPSLGHEQMVVYSLPYRKNTSKREQQNLVLCLFALSLIISVAAYALSSTKTSKI